MILDTSDGEGCMVERHNVAFFIEGADAEAWGEGVGIDGP